MSVSRNYVMFVNLLLRGSTLFLDVYFCTTKGMQKANLSNSGTSKHCSKYTFLPSLYDSINIFLYSHFTLFAWYQILQSINITIYHRSIWIMLNSHKQLKRSWDDPIPTYKIGSRLDVFIAERKWYEVGNVKNTSNTRVSSELTGKMSLG